MSDCFLAAFSDKPCEGRHVDCHLLPRSKMRQEYPYGAIRVHDAWLPAQHPRLELREGRRLALNVLLHDRRATVRGCGGPHGDSGHHGMLDRARSLRIPRAAIPIAVVEFAVEFGLLWWLDRTYA